MADYIWTTSYRETVLLKCQSFDEAPQDCPRARLKIISLSKVPNQWWPQAERGSFQFSPHISASPSLSIQPVHVTCATEPHIKEDAAPTATQGLYY